MDQNNNKKIPAVRPQDDFFLPEFTSLQNLLQLLIVAVLLAFVLVIAGSRSLHPFPFDQLGLSAFLILWIAMASAALLTWWRPQLLRLPRAVAGTVAFLVIVGLTGLLALVGQWIMIRLGVSDPLTYQPWQDFLPRSLMISAILGGVMLRYFYLQEQLRINQRAELSARLQALQSRIRPHFLFNSMNIIASLVHSDPDKAEQAVEDLSTLFRATLQDEGEVPLDEELTLCQRYINIEALRLGERLNVEWRLDGIPDGLRIPLLTLQPLIENAIYHGVEPRFEPSTVRITLSWDGERLTIILTNPVGGSRSGTGNQLALANIRERLTARYGEQSKLTTSADQEIFTTYLSYPYTLSQEMPQEKKNESPDL